MYRYRRRHHDIHVGVAPFFHVMGQIQGMCVPLVSSGTVLILPGFVTDTAARAITRYRAKSRVAATTMVIAILNPISVSWTKRDT